MSLYLDTSVVVKLYIAEEWSAETAELVDGAVAITTVVLTKVELTAALARHSGMNAARQQLLEPLLDRFEADWRRFGTVGLSDEVLDAAAALARRHRLRAYDAVHLAAATTVRERSNEDVVLATFDRALWRAAGAEGLTPWPEGFGA